MAVADKVGRGAIKEDINYVAGWVVGTGHRRGASPSSAPTPTRAKLVETLTKGFTVDTKGLAAPITYTADRPHRPGRVPR